MQAGRGGGVQEEAGTGQQTGLKLFLQEAVVSLVTVPRRPFNKAT